jgi:hypothetical protein
VKIEHRDRSFTVKGVELRHVADIRLEPGELVTLVTPDGAETDVTRTAWGYYATSSLNQRLPDHGLRPALCADEAGKLQLLLVEPSREEQFRAYLDRQGMRVVEWLDDRRA